jgi:hypothetical protein
MHQVASDLNKAKRESFFDVMIPDWDHRDCPQVTAYKKVFSGGYHPLIPGRIIILPANYAIAGLQSGSSRETRFQNGKRP